MPPKNLASPSPADPAGAPLAARAAVQAPTHVPVHIVDVGANPLDGEAPYAPLLAQGGATVLGFEPNPEALARLDAAKGAGETYLPHAVGNGHPQTLHVCRAPGMTSLLAPNPAVLGRFHGFPTWAEVLHRVPVPTVRLDDVAEARGADMLKIDIQGGELMVMRHAEAVLRTVSVIQAEVEFLPMYVDQPLFSDVDQFLRARGFVLHRFHPTVSRVVGPMMVNGDPYAGMGQLLWADAVFVRDFTRPADAFSDHQLLAASRILHACYGSFDLAMHLLAEHDRRTGGARAGAYLAGLQAASRPPAEALAA